MLPRNRSWFFAALAVLAGYACWWMYKDLAPVGQEHPLQRSSWSGDLSDISVVKVGESFIKIGDIDFEHHLLTQVLRNSPELTERSPELTERSPELAGSSTESKAENVAEEVEGERVAAAASGSSGAAGLMVDATAEFPLPVLEGMESSLGSQLGQHSWSSLRIFLLKALIRRKLLFHMVQSDSQFDLTNPELYRVCRERWRSLLVEAPPFFDKRHHRKMLELRVCENHIIETYMQQHITSSVVVSTQEAQEYYLRYRKEFLTPKRITVRHIQFPTEAAARKVYARLRPHNFAAQAREHSIAPESTEGGLLGPYAAHEVPTFLAKAFNLKMNRISPIVKSSYGYHVFLPLKKTSGGMMEFAEAQSQIINFLQHQKKQELRQQWYRKALNTVPVQGQNYLRHGGPI